MGKSEWKAIERTHRRHMKIMGEPTGAQISVVRVANLTTEREQRVAMCLAFCPECRSFLQALIWRRDSPLNGVSDDDELWSPLEMPEVSQRRKAPAPS